MIGLFERNLIAGALILAVLLLRALPARIPARYFKLLWGIAALRLLLPFSLKIALPTVIREIPKGIAEGTAVSGGTAGSSLFPIAYYAVAAAVFGGFLLLHFRNRRGFREAVPCTDEAVLRFLRAASPKRKITVRVSDRIIAPLTYGLFRPIILLPKAVLESREGLELILAHELTHIRHGDIFYKTVLAAAVSIGWLNPLAWVMLALANRDLEYACDEAVLKKHPTERAEYARVLIRTEERKSNILSSAFSGNAVKERIERIMKFKKATMIGSIAAVALAAASLTAFVSADSAAINERYYAVTEDGTREISKEEADALSQEVGSIVCRIVTDGEIISDGLALTYLGDGESYITASVYRGEEGEVVDVTEEEGEVVGGAYKIGEDGSVVKMSDEEYEEMKSTLTQLTEDRQPESTTVEMPKVE